MADERTRRWVTTVFLVVLFLVTTLYIGLTIVRMYTDSSRYSSSKSASSVACVGYDYSVQNANYNNGLLSFEIKNSAMSDYEEINLIIKSGEESKEVLITNFFAEIKKKVDVGITLTDNQFETYPKDCEQDAQKHTIG